ncbi:alpha/beta fold hydrolase [Streptomyces sp. NPDC058371]|uniref:alpha/beta fold hydrolase n=1 Tax=Streptomyces sp. NPDC058371 TaxID=3346463 RepID=UPI0036501ADF
MTFVRIDGVPHHVRVDGSGPVCVLSPGLGMCWFDWDLVVPLLAPHRTVVRFDRPGLGLSGPPRAWPTLDGEARRIAHVLDALGFGGPVTVAGHSLAGFHAEAFARLFPTRTAGLVLLDAGVEEEPRPRRARSARNAATRACGTILSAAGIPYALGPLLRRAAVRAGRTPSAPAPPPPAHRPPEDHDRPSTTRRPPGDGDGPDLTHRPPEDRDRLRFTGRPPGDGDGPDGLTHRPPEGRPRPRRTPGDPAPYALVRRTYGTSRSLRAVLAENATYADEAVELAALRRDFPLPDVPVAVLAAGSPRWLGRQRALAAYLGAAFRVVAPSGHLVMLDRPEDVADALLSSGATEDATGEGRTHVRPPFDEGRAQ